MIAQCSSFTLSSGETLYTLLNGEENNPSTWTIIASNGVEGWQGEISLEDLHKMAKLSAYSPEEFVDLFQQSFSATALHSTSEFIYKLSSTSEKSATLSWSRYLQKDKLTLKLGSIALTQVNDLPLINKSILEALVTQSKRAIKDCVDLRAKMEAEKECAQIALQKLDDYVALQEDSEKMLYGNFVDVINEKKRKIRELSDECRMLRAELDEYSEKHSVKPPETANNRKIKKTSKRKNHPQSAKRSKPTSVSACTKPKATRAQRHPQQVTYESGSDTQEDDWDENEKEPNKTKEVTKKAKPLSQTDEECDEDSDATDVDQMELQATSLQSPPQEKSINCEDSKLIGPTANETRLNNTIPSATVLDDLLGGEKAPPRKISPVKRKDLATVVSTIPPRKSAHTAPKQRRSPTVSSKDDLSLLDDLL